MYVHTMPWLGHLLSGLSSRRSEFDPRLVHEGFMADVSSTKPVLHPRVSVSPINIILSTLHKQQRSDVQSLFRKVHYTDEKVNALQGNNVRQNNMKYEVYGHNSELLSLQAVHRHPIT